jgi:hypothetical protein
VPFAPTLVRRPSADESNGSKLGHVTTPTGLTADVLPPHRLMAHVYTLPSCAITPLRLLPRPRRRLTVNSRFEVWYRPHTSHS